MKTIELLAPAGNLLKMKTAFVYGADAVYLGIPDFSMRVRINQFTLSDIRKGVKYAHGIKKKVYITINIIAHNKHFKKLPQYVKKLKEMGVDALIISDPGVMRVVRKIWPQAEIHLSTQANCTNLETARFWFAEGVNRIILGREVTLQEIKEIKKGLPKLELEHFVHGAMCMAYSGRCFLSKQLVGRSANLGDCAQPCRWEYTLTARGHDDQSLEIVHEKHGAYILNSKDLCLIKYIDKLVKVGLTSLKIEGRAKSVYYQAVVCSIYRRALDLITDNVGKKVLDKELDFLFNELQTKLVNRGYTTGFLLGTKGEQNILNARHDSKWEFCGQIEKIRGNNIIFKVHNTIKVGDKLEIIKLRYDILRIRVNKLFDAKTGKELLEAHGGGGGQIAMINVDNTDNIPILAVMRRMINK